MIDPSCPDCAKFTGGCGRHSVTVYVTDPQPRMPNMLDGLPMDQRKVWDGITHMAIASLCKEDKEQLNRIEEALKIIDANLPRRIQPMPMEITPGASVTEIPPSSEWVGTIPGKVSFEVTMTPDPAGLAKELTRILRNRSAPELLTALRGIR